MYMGHCNVYINNVKEYFLRYAMLLSELRWGRNRLKVMLEGYSMGLWVLFEDFEVFRML